MISVKVVHPDQLLFEGDAEHVLAPTAHGMIGIMPGHTPLFAELVKGDIEIVGPQPKTLTIEAGILKVRGDTVVILVGIE